jgi:peptidoglycan/LPS O-acetylase OafA/YrhL
MTKNVPISENLTIGSNSFGLLRLIAASGVVLSHSWSITSGLTVPEPLQTSTGFSMGWHSVNLFFALSGLLLASSLSYSKSLWSFAFARMLRIYPALIVVLLATIIGYSLVSDGFLENGIEKFSYFVKNLLLIGGSSGLPGLFENTPMQHEINGPLWTLKYEVAAYFSLVMMTVVCSRLPQFLNPRNASLLVLATTGSIMLFFGEFTTHGWFEHGIRLLFAFYLGVIAWHFRDRIYPNVTHLLILLAINAGLIAFEIYYPVVQIIFVGYLGLFLGTQNYGALSTFTDKQDYSYGIYIIGFPIQQAVIAYTDITNPWMNFMISMPIIIILAYCSWNYIEEPALKLKKAFSIPRKLSNNNKVDTEADSGSKVQA